MGKTLLITILMLVLQFLVVFVISKLPEERNDDSFAPLDICSLILAVALIIRIIWGIKETGLELQLGYYLLFVLVIGVGGIIFFDRKNDLVSPRK